MKRVLCFFCAMDIFNAFFSSLSCWSYLASFNDLRGSWNQWYTQSTEGLSINHIQHFMCSLSTINFKHALLTILLHDRFQDTVTRRLILDRDYEHSRQTSTTQFTIPVYQCLSIDKKILFYNISRETKRENELIQTQQNIQTTFPHL